MRLRIPPSVVVSTGLLTIRPPYPSFQSLPRTPIRGKPESSLLQTFPDPGAGSACLPQCRGAHAGKGGHIEPAPGLNRGPPLQENANVISWQALRTDSYLMTSVDRVVLSVKVTVAVSLELGSDSSPLSAAYK